MSAEKKPFEMDCVYLAENTREYRNAHVTVTVFNDAVEIAVMPECEITDGELDDVLRYIENDLLKKARLKLSDECRVVLMYGGQTYAITLTNGKPHIEG